jgi:hypothetical protein
MYSVIPLPPTSTTPRLVVAVFTSAGPVAAPEPFTELAADDTLLEAADPAELAADDALLAADDTLLPAVDAVELTAAPAELASRG